MIQVSTDHPCLRVGCHTMWRDHGDAARRRHDPWSSHRLHSCLWASVFRQVEGRHLTGY
jgi:hypothetical protein